MTNHSVRNVANGAQRSDTIVRECHRYDLRVPHLQSECVSLTRSILEQNVANGTK